MRNYKLQKASAYLKHYGIKKLLRKAVERKSNSNDYNSERKGEIASAQEIARQKQVRFDREPVISILMPAFNTPEKSLTETLESVKNQTYAKWELCVADGGGISVKPVIDKVFKDDSRIKYKSLDTNMGISGNSNEALSLAGGDFVAFLDHDDILEPDTLFEVVTKIVENNADMVYTDEDKVSQDLDNYFRPYRKPDFNKTLLLSNNYICHFCAVSKSIVDKIGGFRSEYDGAQDYDFFLRCIEYAKNIEHVNKVLYHWRVSTQSTADNPFNKEYAFLAGKRAIEDYLKRNGLFDTAAVKELDDPGYFRVEYSKEANVKVELVSHDTAPEADYYLIIDKNMEIAPDWKHHLVGTALLTGADIVAPKVIRNRRYVYNGIAKRGQEFTQSLNGKPMWYRGRFNLGITNMDVNIAPVSGILVSAKALSKVLSVTDKHISNLNGPCRGLKMVYAPEAVLKIKNKQRNVNEQSNGCYT